MVEKLASQFPQSSHYREDLEPGTQAAFQSSHGSHLMPGVLSARKKRNVGTMGRGGCELRDRDMRLPLWVGDYCMPDEVRISRRLLTLSF